MFNRLGLLLMLIAALTVSSCGSRRAGFFHTEEQAVTVSPLAKQLGFSKDRPLVMGMNTSYAPLQYVDDKGTPSGYDVEFTKVLMRRMGIPCLFTVHNIIIRLNGWQGVTVDVPFIQLTTLDENTDARQVTTDPS